MYIYAICYLYSGGCFCYFIRLFFLFFMLNEKKSLLIIIIWYVFFIIIVGRFEDFNEKKIKRMMKFIMKIFIK